MNRKEFMKKSSGLCLGCGAALALSSGSADAEEKAATLSDTENQFIRNWLADLFDIIDTELDEETKGRLFGECGKACFRRHQFKKDFAEKGRGDVDALIAALKQNFDVWRDGDLVHIRYGEASPRCYCPVGKVRAPRPDDVLCNCTRSTFQTIWETALGRPFKLDIVETVRRGGKTCHFVVHLT